jgi:hypothetical protein
MSIQISWQQMHEDFNQFLHIVKTYNAQWKIRKQYTNYDMLAKLEARGSMIDKIENYWQFIDFMNTNLKYIVDVHACMRELYYNTPLPRFAPGQSFYDSTMLTTIAHGYKEYKERTAQQQEHVNLSMNFYLNGAYYMHGVYCFFHRKTGDSIILRNAKILKYDNQPIDDFVVTRIGSLPPYTIRWDFSRQKYYTDWLILQRDKVITVENIDNEKILKFKPDDYNLTVSGISLPEILDNISLYQKNRKNRKPQQVTYLPDQEILYIYTSKMKNIDNYKLTEEIKQEGRDKNIKKIIIDVRKNQGGSDLYWIDMLSAIIKDTISFKSCLALNANRKVKQYFHTEYPEEMIKDFKRSRVPVLANSKMLIETTNNKYTIIPDSNSLKYSGNIYLLQDIDTYSSGHSFTSVARQIPQLISVGMPTGNIAGFGLNPWGFQLNHSKFTFQFEPAIDIALVQTWEDVFQDIPEIEIYPTLEEYLTFEEYGAFLDKSSPEFLKKYDYLFKKVLEMK